MIWHPRWQRIRRFFRKLSQIAAPPANESLLNDLLSEQLSAASLAEQIGWFERILVWAFPQDGGKSDARLRLLIKALEKNPSWKANFRSVFFSLMQQCRFLPMFTHVGIAVERGLWGDLSDRVRAKLIPGGGTENFSDVLLAALRHDEQVEEIRNLSTETLSSMLQLLAPDESDAIWQRRSEEMREAFVVLAIHAAHHGLTSQIRMRIAADDSVTGIPFVPLVELIQAGKIGALEDSVTSCERAVEQVYEHMEVQGVSVDVVNRLETISALLARIRTLHAVMQARGPAEVSLRVRDLVVAAVEAGLRGKSIRGYVRHHFYLLSRKIAERNGESGEHYIAHTRAEFMSLLRSGLGGGVIVVIMTILKLTVTSFRPAPLFLAIQIAVVYSAGFLAMQFAGFTLATKIPSFAASRLATLLNKLRRKSGSVFRQEFRLVLKSQGMALLGNITGVLAFGALIVFLSHLLFGQAPMRAGYAEHALADLNPFSSFAVPLGILTGVQLWLSSLAGGWFENWIVFNRVPSALAGHLRIKRLFGDTAGIRLGQWVQKHASGIATNIALGCLFGFTPLLGALFRANWNGNHVTISTATALFASTSLEFSHVKEEIAFAVLGLMFIALMNFAFSFGLALYVAASSERIKFGRVLYYLRRSF